MKKIFFPLFFLLTALFLISCNYSKKIKIGGRALGTYYRITYIGEKKQQSNVGLTRFWIKLTHNFPFLIPLP